SLPAVVGAVAPELTVAAPPVVPLDRALWSTAATPAAVDSPEYSRTVTPTSALADGVTVIVGFVPPPAVIGAVQMLCSVPSDATKCSTSVYVFPALSVTVRAVGLPLFQMPTSTIRRLPAVMAADGTTARLVRFSPCAVTPWTNAGAGVL